MPAVKLGEKHICSSCGAKFYDLGKRPATCPKCGTVLEEEPEPVSRRKKPKAPAKAPAAAAAPAKSKGDAESDDGNTALDVKDEDFEELEDLDEDDDTLEDV